MLILDDIIKSLRKEEKSITKSHHQWIRVGFALKKELGEYIGLQYFHKFSKMDNNYHIKGVDEQFFDASDLPSSPTFGTIIYYAMEQNKTHHRFCSKQITIKNFSI